MITPTLRLNALDDVIIARMELQPGTEIPEEGIICLDTIPPGHKLSTRPVQPDEPIRKYGQIIGFATSAIKPGEHVHTHNLTVKEFDRDYAYGEDTILTELLPERSRITFDGFVRADGQAGTRNYLGVLPTVNCSASVCRFIADALQAELRGDYPNVDGVVALSHEGGCSGAATGEGHKILQRTLSGYIRHANFAGVLLVGLGCEVNQIEDLLADRELETGPELQTLIIQDVGGIEKTVHEGLVRLREMIQEADRIERTPVPISHITVGLECGGSDAFSGITANPAMGVAVDMLIKHGGTAILSETPEVYGAEHLLTRRAISHEVGEKLVARIDWWKEYTAQFDQHPDNNPSPGNKAGGLTTILEKSMGAIVKGGSTNLTEVLHYAERATQSGLVFMDTPGFDAASVTGKVAGGANIICFSTGRGSVFGCKPVPTLKLATNSTMYRHMVGDMDLNCGLIADGQASVQQMGEQIFQLILEASSGKKTKSELAGIGDHEFVPWRIGPVL